jgi:hypothetical protein
MHLHNISWRNLTEIFALRGKALVKFCFTSPPPVPKSKNRPVLDEFQSAFLVWHLGAAAQRQTAILAALLIHCDKTFSKKFVDSQGNL